MENGTVYREIFRMVIPAWVDRAVPFSFGQKFPEIYDREILQTEIFSNGTVISDQNGPTEKAVHLERWTFFSEHFPVCQNRSIQVSYRNFRKCLLNGKRPIFLDGMVQTEIRVPFLQTLSLIPVSGSRSHFLSQQQ